MTRITAIALAWIWLVSGGGMAAMPGMAPDPWSSTYLLAAFIMWALMMVAMMLPSAAPMILLHARIYRAQSSAERLLNNALFVLAYILVWGLFSAAAAIAQAVLIDAELVSAATLALGQRNIAIALLLLAAAYQLSSVKAACLDQCRSPIQFVMRYWKPRAAGAVRLGIRHGLYCLGCCWSLMLLLFVGGVMNLVWIAVLAAIVFVEKLAPVRWQISRWIAAALAGVAVLTLIGPH